MSYASASNVLPTARPQLQRSVSPDLGANCRVEGCTRKSWNGNAGELCCLECEASNGESHKADCDELQECVQKAARWRKALQAGVAEKLGKFRCNSDEALLDTASLKQVLAHLDSMFWTSERIEKLTRLFEVEKDGTAKFSEFIAWATCQGPERDLTGVPVGCEPQNISVRVKAAPGGGSFAARIRANIPGGFLLNISRTATVKEISDLLSIWLGVPSENLILTSSDGIPLRQRDESIDSDSNGVTLPGPAARRRGEKLDLNFDAISAEVTTSAEDFLRHVDEEIWSEGKEDHQQAAKYRESIHQSMIEKQKLQELGLKKDPDVELDEFICQRIGVSKEKFDELQASQRKMEAWLEAGYVKADMNYLVLETSEEAKSIIGRLLGRRVIRIYRNENDTLKRRYEAAKERLRNCGRAITKERTQTQQQVTGQPPLDHLGPYDPNLNEYPMWHGTGIQGISGIARTNFSIEHCGKHGLAYGTGFYFADQPTTSISYTSMEGGYSRVNAKYPRLSYILLNRVMCGNIKHFERTPMNRQEFDTWTADCLGSGGVWAGKDAKYECIRSPGNFCWVAVHSHQIYPAYVILFEA